RDSLVRVCERGRRQPPPDRHGTTGQLPVWGSTGAAGRCYRTETSPGVVLGGVPPVPEVPDGARSPGGRARLGVPSAGLRPVAAAEQGAGDRGGVGGHLGERVAQVLVAELLLGD